MKILLIGATGFIGKKIYEKLSLSNFNISISTRDLNNSKDIYIDYSKKIDTEYLTKKLVNFNILINAIGIISENKYNKFKSIHTDSPIAIFDIAKKVGIKHIIQISALNSETQITDYFKSKNRADEYLKNIGIRYTILKPSIVYGENGKSTALFSALSTLPIIPIIGNGLQRLQPIHIDDLTNIIIKSIENSSIKNIELNVVGEKVITYKNLLFGFRKYLGYKKTFTISIPTLGVDKVGKILEEPTISRNNIIMLNQESIADIEPLKNFLGYSPEGIDKKLFTKEASNSQKLYSSLYFIRPLLRLIIALVWIISGVVSIFFFPEEKALQLLNEIGISKNYDLLFLYIASFLDIGIGILTLIGYRLRQLLLFQILIISVYTLLLTLLAPYHWAHPFGYILKNIPLIITTYILLKMEEYR